MAELMFPGGCVVTVGLKSEAALLPPGTRTLISGGDTSRLEAALAALPADVTAVLSFGIAGGLAADVAAGDILVASSLWDAAVNHLADPAWMATLVARTAARIGPLAASETLLNTPGAKAALHRRTGALAVDMESGAAARFAMTRGIPFAVLRAVADGPRDVLPMAASVGLNSDGSTAPLRVLAALTRHPMDLLALLRLARASACAHAALRRALA